MVRDPFSSFADVVVLDGGLATQLEARDADLSDDLWSARLLLDDPGLIVDVHRSYVEAGADVVIGASYQASFEGLERRGLGPPPAAAVLRRRGGVPRGGGAGGGAGAG